MAYDLKNEEDVKDYVENLGIEYRFGCFSEKNPESCQLLGDYLEGIKKDFEKAAKIYQSNCDESKYARSCYKFGSYCYLGKGVKKDVEKAFTYFCKGCDAGFPDACMNAGLMCVSGSPGNENKTKDYTKGIELLSKACDGDSAFSCYYLSGIYISGVADVITKDMKKAFRYATSACDLGNMYSCANLSLMYRKGDGTEKNEQKSTEMKEKALEMQRQLKEQKGVQFQQ